MVQYKTNAMRLLDTNNIKYDILTYKSNDGKIDGLSVATKIGKDPTIVYKTLVASGNSRSIYVFVIPVSEELDLKKAAKITGDKKVELVHVRDINKHTGYIRGGCSPIGMKKSYPTYIDKSADLLDSIVVSGGKVGVQIQITIDDLVSMTNAKLVEIVK